MGIEVTDGKLRVSAAYSLKVPGAAPYSSEDAHFSFSVEYDIDGDVTAAMAQAEKLAAQLEASAKLNTFRQLDVKFEETVEGVLRPILEAKAAPAPQQQPQSRPQGGGGGKPGGDFGPPKVSEEERKALPLIYVDFGKGTAQYRDQRSLKQAGKYSARAADFVNTEDRQDSQWLTGKDGSLNQFVVDKLVAAGVDATPVS